MQHHTIFIILMQQILKEVAMQQIIIKIFLEGAKFLKPEMPCLVQYKRVN